MSSGLQASAEVNPSARHGQQSSVNDLQDGSGAPAVSLLLSRLLILVALVAQVWIAWRFWATTWDDSAITLGFARTFAHTGRIEPTPGSGIVEGYSTTLWMLLMTLAAKLVTSPGTLLILAKLATLALNLANILLIRRWFSTWTAEPVANLVAGMVGCSVMFAETINGMETPLILALVLGMLLLRGAPGRIARWSYLLLGVAFVLTRWEAVWLLAVFVLVERGVRPVVSASAVWLSAFAASNLVRWRYFGSVLPNTILAKRGTPYSPAGASALHKLRLHLGEPTHLLGTCEAMVLVVLGWFLLERLVFRQRSWSLPVGGWQLRFSCLFVLFSLVLTAAIGPNWGPPFRSFFAAWPFLYCLLLLPLANAARSRMLPWATAALCVVALLHGRAQIQLLKLAAQPYYMPGATVGDVAQMSSVLGHIQAASDRQDLLFAGPDMGAVLLYTRGVRVLDLALLCDPVLARRRYPAVDEYVLRQRRPDVIEIHRMWTKLTDVGRLERFRKGYVPVYVDGIRVFITHDLLASIAPRRLTEKSFDADGRPSDTDWRERRYIDYLPEDFALNREFGRYFVLQ